MSYSSTQLEIALSNLEVPMIKKSCIKDKLSYFGISLGSDDKVFIEDNDGDRVEIDEDNMAYFSNQSTTKFIIVKYEQLLAGHKSYKYAEDLSLTAIQNNNFEFCDLELNKLLESFPTIENNKNNNNYSVSLESSFDQSVIFTHVELCFHNLLKKYISDLHSIITSGSSENEIQKFYYYFNKENLNYLMEQFTLEEIKQAKEMIQPFHNVFIAFNDYKNTKINELLKSIKSNYEKLKAFEFNILNEKRKLKQIKHKYETNKSYFNRFMIELQENIRDLGLNLNNNNFEDNFFDDNLSKIFSFVIKLCYDYSKVSKKSVLKSEKYINTKRGCSKHSFCDDNCPFNADKKKDKIYNQLTSINRIMCEDIYKGDKLYDV